MLRFAEPHIYTPVDDSLVLWISGRGRGVGSKVFDLSGKGNHGTIYGATWKNTSLGHSALSFDGVDDYISIQDDESLDIADELTIETWIYPLEKSDAYRTIVAKGYAGIENYHLRMDRTSQGNHVMFEVGDGSNTYASPLISINNNQWYYVVGYFAEAKVGIFINGIDKGFTPFEGTVNINDIAVTIGRNSYGEYWNGLIGEVRLHNRGFSAEEIREIYNMTKHLYGY